MSDHFRSTSQNVFPHMSWQHTKTLGLPQHLHLRSRRNMVMWWAMLLGAHDSNEFPNHGHFNYSVIFHLAPGIARAGRPDGEWERERERERERESELLHICIYIIYIIYRVASMNVDELCGIVWYYYFIICIWYSCAIFAHVCQWQFGGHRLYQREDRQCCSHSVFFSGSSETEQSFMSNKDQ